MVEIDGSRYSGSGTIVRQAVALAALTGKAVQIVNARARRPKPGLRPQHVRVVDAIRQLVNGRVEGLTQGSQELVFEPGKPNGSWHYQWDIGSAGSTTSLAIAVLPVLAFGPSPVSAEIRGGILQDFAPSFFHLESVLLPLLGRMGIQATVRMERPGYVPTGGGILRLEVTPVRNTIQPLVFHDSRSVERIWGIALSSRLKSQSVSDRMADALKGALNAAGYEADVRVLYDDTALQPGAGLAAFADLTSGSRLGADRAGAPGRRSEAIGRYVARQLVEDLKTGAALDRYAADQIIPFAALGDGQTRVRIPRVTEHIESNTWLCREILGAEVEAEDQELVVKGIGFRARSA